VLAERVQYRGAGRHELRLDRSDPISVQQAIAKPIKVRSKVALRVSGAWAHIRPNASLAATSGHSSKAAIDRPGQFYAR
jgi:hypothetical protein